MYMYIYICFCLYVRLECVNVPLYTPSHLCTTTIFLHDHARQAFELMPILCVCCDYVIVLLLFLQLFFLILIFICCNSNGTFSTASCCCILQQYFQKFFCCLNRINLQSVIFLAQVFGMQIKKILEDWYKVISHISYFLKLILIEILFLSDGKEIENTRHHSTRISLASFLWDNIGKQYSPR